MSSSPSPRSEFFDNYTTMTIGSWSEATKLGNGRYIKSNRIAAGGHSWRIALYPNGRLAGTTASMSLFLLLDDDDNNAAAAEDVVHAKFRFLMHDSRSPVFMSSTVTAPFSSSRRSTLSNAHGFERFVSRHDFEKTAFFKNDCFSIQCRFTVFPPGSRRPAAVQTVRSPSGRPDPSVVQVPPPTPPASPKPSMERVPTPTPCVVRVTVTPPAASRKPSVVVTVAAPTPPPAQPKPSVVLSPPPTPTTSVVTVRVTLPSASPSPKPSVSVVVTAAAPRPTESASPAPPMAMSSAPPLPVRADPLVAGVSGPPASVPAGPLSGLPADLGHLLETKKGADVDLEVHGKVFAAHKSVLAARSPVVFMEELFGPAKENDTSYVRVVPDMCPEAFEALLHFVYTDTLPPAVVVAMNSPPEELAEDLLAAADRYELKDLKMLTENKLCDHVGVSTVLPMLVLAERHQCLKLKKMCLEFVGSCGNTSAVMATNGLETLARSSPSVIKDVITEILDAREARRWRLINFCIFAFCFILPFLLFSIFS